MHKEGALKTLFGQLVRFGLVGGFSTILYAAIYWPLATYVVHPVLAVVIAFSIAVAIGYVLHSNWSFRGHGKGSEGGRTQARFLSVQSVGMVLNVVFTWVLTGPLFHGPTWWPLIPAVLVTPLVTFVLNRYWVFG
ncbi:GtrA family protein [Sphingosinicella sp.]|uniref:GtrA family protein n=1 Tax=Sphingosinicella sp. TaxID=1917971 RepID=UPI004037ABBD